MHRMKYEGRAFTTDFSERFFYFSMKKLTST